LVVTGTGKYFTSGADLATILQPGLPKTIVANIEKKNKVDGWLQHSARRWSWSRPASRPCCPLTTWLPWPWHRVFHQCCSVSSTCGLTFRSRFSSLPTARPSGPA
jgi:hypothetical protein